MVNAASGITHGRVSTTTAVILGLANGFTEICSLALQRTSDTGNSCYGQNKVFADQYHMTISRSQV